MMRLIALSILLIIFSPPFAAGEMSSFSELVGVDKLQREEGQKISVATQKRHEAQAQIELLATACDTFRLDMNRFPISLEELIVNPGGGTKWGGPYLRRTIIPRDPWGNVYEYRAPGVAGRSYDIVSYGADGNSGGDGEDSDIVSWSSQ